METWSPPFSRAAAAIFIGVCFAGAQNPPGIRPRPTPADYAASQQSKSAIYAASIVPADEVKHIFAVDISKTYVVFEVACYPSQKGTVTLSPDDFLIKTAKNPEFVHSADAVTVASVIQEKNAPSPPSARSTDIYTEANIGYESTTDPYTGRRVHGTYTDTNVGIGNGPNDPYAYPPRPGSSPQDRMILEDQLAWKALPAGTFTAPVAGFLYFPASSLKKSNGRYELQYLSDPSAKVRLQIISKNR